jgi:tRNA dimethylallyltransferase
MFRRGLIEEVRQILASGVAATAKPFESLGYKQALDLLQGRVAYSETVASTQAETRRYAKRQMTWFRREAGVRWFAGFGNDSMLQDTVLLHVSGELSSKS